MNDKKNILICPLEWGLGHAGRMVPVARKLLELNHKVFFGSGKEHLDFFKTEVPQSVPIYFPGFRIKYSHILPQYLIILLQAPRLVYHIILEHYRLGKIISDHSIDIVISDYRIGLWNKGVKSVFVTHQVKIRFPRPFRLLEFTGLIISRSIIRKYTFCFIPDLGGDINLSGNLSHGFRLPGNTRYIGILSRFNEDPGQAGAMSGKCTVILSGPEPQRSILKKKLTKILLNSGSPCVILEGKPEEEFKSQKLNNILCYNHLPAGETTELLRESNTIITRPGYTTVMELASLGISALLVPTPGQTEQEYIAEYLSQKGWFTMVSQKELNENSITLSCKGRVDNRINEESHRLFEAALRELLEG